MTQETRHDLRFPLFAVATVAAAAIMALLAGNTAVPVPLDQNALILGLLVAAAVASEVLAVLYPKSVFSVSMSFPLGIAVSAYFGPAYGALVGLLLALSVAWPRSARKWDRILFNVGQLILTFTSAGFLFQLLGHLLMLSGPTRADGVVVALLVAAVAVTAGVAINTLLVVLGASVLYGQSIPRTLSEGVAATVPSQLTLGIVGVLMAQVAAAIGAPGLALFVVPLLVARQTYERTVQLRGAYADTIASLVAALEAKDVYTKGHSVRVAKYACATARHLGMPDAKVDRLEWAALLHDIGKVGVSRRVLSKNGKLSESEYNEIKRHPAIGARILEDVPYLADLVPSIEAHHERLDGSGYGSGVSGPAIPLEARVLAVADAYDAMTSTRPYRTAMPHSDAVDQLQSGRGTQFDGEVVDAFLAAFADSSLSDEGALA